MNGFKQLIRSLFGGEPESGPYEGHEATRTDNDLRNEYTRIADQAYRAGDIDRYAQAIRTREELGGGPVGQAPTGPPAVAPETPEDVGILNALDGILGGRKELLNALDTKGKK